MATDDELHKLAEEELLREAKLGAIRASVVGAMGWHKCSAKRTNKRFLKNTILFTVNSNKRIGNKTDVKHLSDCVKRDKDSSHKNVKRDKIDAYCADKSIKKCEDTKKDSSYKKESKHKS